MSASTSPPSRRRRLTRRPRSRRPAPPPAPARRSQRAMDEHPDRALRPTEHAGDLRRAQLVDEAQDHRLPALAGQPPDGAPRGPASSRRTARFDVDVAAGSSRCRLADRLDRASRARAARRRPRCGRSGTARRGTSRRPRRRPDARAPRTAAGSSGPRRTSPRWRPPRRDGRRARSRRRSTRGRGTCDTGRRTGPGRAARPRPAVGPSRWAIRGTASFAAPTLHNARRGHLRYTPPEVGHAADVDDLADRRRRPRDRRRSARRSAHESAPVSTSTPGRLDSTVPSGRSRRTRRPFVSWRSAQPPAGNSPDPQRRVPRSRRPRKPSSSELAVERDGSSPPAARSDWSSTRRARAGSRRAAQSTLSPIPMTARGSSVPRPSVSPSTPPSLRTHVCGRRRTPRSATRRRGRSATSGGSCRAAAPATSSAASAIASETIAASCQARSGGQPRRSEAERAAGAPRPAAPSRSGPFARGPPTARRRRRRRPRACPPRASPRRRRSSSRRVEPLERATSHARPAALSASAPCGTSVSPVSRPARGSAASASTGSGRSSSNAPCSASSGRRRASPRR